MCHLCPTAICPVGFQFDSDNKVCVGCLLGYYKNKVGNAELCEMCPVGKTTSFENSTTINACSVDDCQAGYRRESPGCIMCEKGKYQNKPSQMVCDRCGSGLTTENIGSTKQEQCIKDCFAGMEYDFVTKDCKVCLKGFFTNRPTTEKCIQCPSGQTTAFGGSNICYQNTVPTSVPPLASTIEMAFVFRGIFDCSDYSALRNFRELIRWEIIKQFERLAQTYPLLCTSGCSNVQLLIISITSCLKNTGPSGRRRRTVEDNQLSFSVQLPDVPATLTSTGTNNVRPAVSVIQEDLTINLDLYAFRTDDGRTILKPLNATVTRIILSCHLGQVQSGSNCVDCPVGTKSSSSQCIDCELNTYQDETGQTTCKACSGSVMKYTVATGSNSSDLCISICPVGFQFDSDKKECVGCLLGYYKNTVGNAELCEKCPVNKTTVFANSTSINACSAEICPVGFQFDSDNKVCVGCLLGYYKNKVDNAELCEKCPVNKTTEFANSTSINACSAAICPVGFQFDSNKKVCVGCLLGYYKDKVGNSELCEKCPVNKTTGFANSTTINACSVEDCHPGYRRQSPGCVECEKGTYQNESSQMTCDICGSGYTTETSRSTKQEQCIKDCAAGMEYDFATKDCKACLKGFHTNHALTEKCIQCPSGQTTIFGGSNTCIQNIVTTSAPPLPSTIEMVFVFRAEFDCDNEEAKTNYIGYVKKTIMKQLEALAQNYPLLCTSNCQNVKLMVISISSCVKYPDPSGRRKRAVDDNQLSFSVKVPDVPATVINNGTDNARPVVSVIQEDLALNADRYTPTTDAGIPILKPLSATVNITLNCPTGQMQSGSICVLCPVGTKFSSSQCIDCELNTYQDETGQSTCKSCSGTVMKYTLTTRSSSSDHCISICVKTPGYCNFGTCHADQHSQLCTCKEGYQGSRCESKAEKTSSNTAIIGGAVGGGVGLLVIVLIVVIVCSRFYGEKSEDIKRKKFNRMYDMESDAPYRNPMYDNRAYPRQMLAAYPYDWGSDQYVNNPYAPYMAQKYSRSFGSDEDYHQPKGTPKETPDVNVMIGKQHPRHQFQN